MSINYLRIGAIFGFFSVAFGAFGAHALKSLVAVEDVEIFQTGVRYQFYHSFALLAVGLVMLHLNNNYLRNAAKCFIIGTLFFSGSLYLLSFRGVVSFGFFRNVLGPMTPIGGVILMAGWLLFFIGIGKRN